MTLINYVCEQFLRRIHRVLETRERDEERERTEKRGCGNGTEDARIEEDETFPAEREKQSSFPEFLAAV